MIFGAHDRANADRAPCYRSENVGLGHCAQVKQLFD